MNRLHTSSLQRIGVRAYRKGNFALQEDASCSITQQHDFLKYLVQHVGLKNQQSGGEVEVKE